jgi:triosephosphate isomerase
MIPACTLQPEIRMPRNLVAGNWKMNGLRASMDELDAMIAGAENAGCDVLVCPPATLVAKFAWRAGTGKQGRVAIGGQDCHPAASGAHTGDVSAEMLADAGASHVIVGHSERRADHGEDDALVRAKAEAARRAGLVAIVCVGETEAERDAGRALEVVGGQLAGSVPEGATPENTVVAYEPVWAIGTGRTPSGGDIAEMHGHMRHLLADRFGQAAEGIRLLYGGSVKPGNAAEIFAVANVDGALVGGASLKAADFLGIVAAARR